ncbi:VanZ family protein [Leucobacter sp. USCH14]|uniref:VanZ family protein n=1 Tax=Leucobacter sp. USCH14 TaxID=3024838 RepID=UPI00309E72F1
MAIYAAGIFANTVFPIHLDPVRIGQPWTPHVALVPFNDYEVGDALMNIGVFVPLGVLIPLLMRRPSAWKVLVAAATTSFCIEAAQLAAQAFFAGGDIADVNDFIWNVTGGMLGYGLLRLASRSSRVSRELAGFRWHDAAGVSAVSAAGAVGTVVALDPLGGTRPAGDALHE